MNQQQPQGFALILVIIAMFFGGVLILVSASTCRTLQFQADQMQVNRVTENLQASAQAWVTHQEKTLPGLLGSVRVLDASLLTQRPSEITCSPGKGEGAISEVTLGTIYQLGLHRVVRHNKMAVSHLLIPKK